jgi:hypothetical protein
MQKMHSCIVKAVCVLGKLVGRDYIMHTVYVEDAADTSKDILCIDIIFTGR